MGVSCLLPCDYAHPSKSTLQCYDGFLIGGPLISGDRSGTALLWDLGSEQPIRILRGHAGHVSVVTAPTANGPEGLYFTGAQDGTVRAWDVRAGVLSPATVVVISCWRLMRLPCCRGACCGNAFAQPWVGRVWGGCCS